MYTKFWTESNEEFEALRQIACSDPGNKNQNDFSKSKLIIESHVVYGALYSDDGDPIAMCGLKEILPGIGRMMNRGYVFPEYRNRHDTILNFSNYMIKPMLEMSPFNTHILTMVNRTGREKGAHDQFFKLHEDAWPNHWHVSAGYLHTGNGDKNPNSWQRFITDNKDHQFETISYDQWLLMKHA